MICAEIDERTKNRKMIPMEAPKLQNKYSEMQKIL